MYTNGCGNLPMHQKEKKTIRLQANVKGAGFMRHGMAVNMFVKP